MTHLNVIINADDFGLTESVSRGIAELIHAEAVSSTTIMACASDVEVSYRHVGRGVIDTVAGVHLQLTGGRSLTGRRSLIDPSTGRLYAHPIPTTVQIDDVYAEWDAQIEFVSALLGNAPSHLDSHHGYHRDARFTPAYLALAEAHGLPVRGGNERIAAASQPSTDVIIRDWTTKQAPLEALIAELAEIESRDELNGTVEVVTHPGYTGPELRERSALNDVRELELEQLFRLPALGEKLSWTLATHAVLTSDG